MYKVGQGAANGHTPEETDHGLDPRRSHASREDAAGRLERERKPHSQVDELVAGSVGASISATHLRTLGFTEGDAPKINGDSECIKRESSSPQAPDQNATSQTCQLPNSVNLNRDTRRLGADKVLLIKTHQDISDSEKLWRRSESPPFPH
ncbi:hypothetical protein B0H17DRAFT_1144296 [Mycena rosella]|uniref:Uncharacterized protein n=1 Tax=Mycena rosella TaxID=1033263 RepID=A0AAD7CU03_MYCRO|nr:hypothetical protein B0H17DRAFT_1144296 [Mycena rosella]